MRLPPSSPTRTGTAAAVTAVTGAITLITPPASVRKKTHQARRAREARGGAPGQVGGPDRTAEPREEGQQRHEADDLGHGDHAEDRRPPAGQAAQEVGGAVDDGRGQRQHDRHAHPRFRARFRPAPF